MQIRILLGTPPMFGLRYSETDIAEQTKGINIMKNKAVKIGIVASILPHLFCCVLPIVLSLIGLFAPEVAHTSFIPESVEPWIFVFSALMLVLSWILVLRDCPCAECGGEKSHKRQKIILSVITILFIVSVVLHIFAH